MEMHETKRLVEVEPAPGHREWPEASAPLRLKRRVDGQLWASWRSDEQPVWVTRCFPWTEPGRFISLRNRDDEEFALVRDPRELDAGSRDALATSLVEAGFVLEITGVEACEEEVEIRTWSVQTRQGRRSFQTRRDEWPRDMPGGGLLISDVWGDLFYIPDTDALDAKSRDLLWAFVD